MSDWTQRISPHQAAEMLRQATAAGQLQHERAVIFHDLDLMRKRIACLQQAFPRGTIHAVAVKANPLVEVLRHVQDTGAGLEAASLEEVELAFAAGCPAERIVFDSPAKTTRELEIALARGVHINADNFEELARIDTILKDQPSTSHIGLRINTQVGTGSISSTSVAGRSSKFGVPLSNQAAILASFAEYDWLTGLHAHVGSQGCDPRQLIQSGQRLAQLQQAINSDVGDTRIRFVDIGGGLPVQYRDEDAVPALGDYVAALRDAAPSLFEPSVCLITEFGRSVQAGCGVAFSRVEYVKESGSLGVVHLGADMFLRWVYHPRDWHHDVFALDSQGSVKNGNTRAVSLAGPLCFGGDFLAKDCQLPPLAANDWIGFRDVGAYTLSMWSRHCSRGIPLVLGYQAKADTEFPVLRRRERAEDVVTFWS